MKIKDVLELLSKYDLDAELVAPWTEPDEGAQLLRPVQGFEATDHYLEDGEPILAVQVIL